MITDQIKLTVLNNICTSLNGYGVYASIYYHEATNDPEGIICQTLQEITHILIDFTFDIHNNVNFKIVCSYQKVYNSLGTSYYTRSANIPWEFSSCLNSFYRNPDGSYYGGFIQRPNTDIPSVVTTSPTEASTSSYSEEATAPVLDSTTTTTNTTATATSSQDASPAAENSEPESTTEDRAVNSYGTATSSMSDELVRAINEYDDIDSVIYYLWKMRHRVELRLTALEAESQTDTVLYRSLKEQKASLLNDWKKYANMRLDFVNEVRRIDNTYNFQRDYKIRFPSEKKSNHNADAAKTLFSVSKEHGAPKQQLDRLRQVIRFEEKYGATSAPAVSTQVSGAGAGRG